MNLNNTPSAGPLRAEELTPWRRTGAMTGVDIDAVLHRKHPADCTGPCDQGRKLCPCPTACGIDSEPRNARPLPWYMAELLGVPHQVITGAAVAALIVVGWLAFN